MRINRANATHDARAYNFYRDLIYSDRDRFITLLSSHNIDPWQTHDTFTLSVPFDTSDHNVTVTYNELALKKTPVEKSFITRLYDLPRSMHWRTVEDCQLCDITERSHASSFAPVIGYHMYMRPTRDQIHARMRARLGYTIMNGDIVRAQHIKHVRGPRYSYMHE